MICIEKQNIIYSITYLLDRLILDAVVHLYNIQHNKNSIRSCSMHTFKLKVFLWDDGMLGTTWLPWEQICTLCIKPM